MSKIIIDQVCYESLPCSAEDFCCNCCDFEGKAIAMCDNGRCPACDIVGVEENRLFVENGRE